MGKKSGLVGVAVLVLPVLELVALVAVGGALGFFRTIALLILAAFVGSWIVRFRMARLALTTATAVQADVAAVPRAVGSAVLGLIGGVLVLIPGFITSVLGLALQLPPVRALLAHRVSSQFTTTVGSVGNRFGGRGDVIDVDVVDPKDPSANASPELS